MIRVNLAKKQSKGGGGSIDLKNFKLSSLIEMIRGGAGGEDRPKLDFNNPIVRLAVCGAAIWYFGGYLDDLRTEQTAKVDAEIAKYEKEKSTVGAKLAKIKGWEPIKKQLEDDEKSIRLKLDVVKKLLDDRDAPSKMLLQIAQLIPDQVWLTGLNVTDDSVKISGQTPGYNDVSDFIKNLNGTSQFTEIGLSGIQEQGTGAQSDQKIQSFDLIAKRRKGT